MNRGRVGRATRPGHEPEWLFVVGHAFVAAVPAATSSAVVAELAALASAAQVGLETVVSVIPLGGDSAVHSFAVVVPEKVPENLHAENPDGHPDGIAVSVVIRGEIAADIYSVGGSRRFTDGGIRPWLLADFRSVVGVVFGSPRFRAVAPDGLRGGELVPLGVTPGDSLFWSSAPPSDGRSQAEHEAEQQADQDAEQDQGHESDEVRDIHDTILRPRAGLDDTILRPHAGVEDTILRPAVDSSPGRLGAGDAVVPPAGGTSQEARATQPVEPVEPANPVRADPPRYGFRVSGGEERRLDSVYYLGRRPVPPRVRFDSDPLLLAVDSRTSAVSSTHLEIRQVGDSVVVTDLGSTNGTVVCWPIGTKERLRGGQSLAVMPGTTVDIGDGNIIEILPVSGR